MKRRISLLLLVLVLFTGCGKIEGTEGSEEDSTAVVQDSKHTVDSDGSGETDTDTEEEIVIEEGKLQPGEGFDNGKQILSCIGLKEYTELSTEEYTDKPAEGNVYLVLFLNMKNHTRHEIYFTPNGLTATVDGKEVESTYLINNPDGYESIFHTIPLDSECDGYIVWEVSENWKELQYTYDGLSFSENIKLSGTLNSKDLFDPEVHVEDDEE